MINPKIDTNSIKNLLRRKTLQYVLKLTSSLKKLEYTDPKNFLLNNGILNNRVDIIYILTNNEQYANSIPERILEYSYINRSSIKYLPIMEIAVERDRIPALYTVYLPYYDIDIAQELKNNVFGVWARDLKKFIKLIVKDKVFSKSFIPVTILDQPIDYIASPFSSPELIQVINYLS